MVGLGLFSLVLVYMVGLQGLWLAGCQLFVLIVLFIVLDGSFA